MMMVAKQNSKIGHIVKISLKIWRRPFDKLMGKLLLPVGLIIFMFRRSRIGVNIRGKAEKIRFRITRMRFMQTVQIRELGSGSSVAWWLASQAVLQFIYLLFVASVLLLLPFFLHRHGYWNGWAFSVLPAIDGNASFSLLTTVAQSAAAMLALFFTAVSVVVSTTYLKVSSEIRSLIIWDDLNSFYIRLLSHTAAVAFLGVILIGMKFPLSYPFVAYIFILICLCLLGFLSVASRVFLLFDPGKVAPLSVKIFFQNMKDVTSSSSTWMNAAFQKYSGDNGNNQVRILEELVDEITNEDHRNSKPIMSVVRAIGALIGNHAIMKNEIPIDSYWFPRTAEFKPWHATNSSAASIAIQTGTAPGPNLVPNPWQTELRGIEMIKKCLHRLAELNAFAEIANLLQIVSKVEESLAFAFEVKSGQVLLEAILPDLTASFVDNVEAKDIKSHMHNADIFCFSALTTIMHPILNISDKIQEIIGKDAEEILDFNLRKAYSRPRPRGVLIAMEELSKRIVFEYQSEGQIQTTKNWVKSIVANAYYSEIAEIVKNIPNIIENLLLEPALNLIAANKIQCASIYLQRGLEACSKAQNRIEGFGLMNNSILALIQDKKRGGEEYLNESLSRVEDLRLKIITGWAQIIQPLCTRSSSADLPDHLGQARALIGEELVQALIGKREEQFQNLFLAYFNATAAIWDQLVSKMKTDEPGRWLPFLIDIQLDLMEISGLSIIFSEIDKTKCWTYAKAVWDARIAKFEDPSLFMRALFTSMDSSTSVPLFSPSSLQRINWEGSLYNALCERGIKTEEEFQLFTPSRRSRSELLPIVKALNFHLGHPSHKAYEIFGALYLTKIPISVEIEMSWSLKSCIRAIGGIGGE